MALLEVEDLSFHYPQGAAVSLPRLTLQESCPAALCGVSGSGKSTLLECLGLIRQAQCRRFVLSGQELNALTSESARAKFRQSEIGYMPQSGGLIDFLTIKDNLKLQIALALKARGQGREDRLASELYKKAVELAAELDIDQLLHRYPHQLSIGQRQRAVFCRALSARPALLLIDEPTAALDPPKARLLFELMLRVCRHSACACLVVTHDAAGAALFPVQVRRSAELSYGEVSVFVQTEGGA